MIGTILQNPLGVLLAIVALGVLIIVHEAGHYLVARWSKMRVDRFSIGFGPPIARFQRGETSFQIGMIPLGGFVQIAGMNPEEQNPGRTIEVDGKTVYVDGGPDDPRLYNNRPVYQRFATILAGPATNYVFAALLMVLVYVGFGLPTPAGPPIVVGLVNDYPAQVAGLQPGDEVVSLGGRPVKERTDVVKIVNEMKDQEMEVVVLRDKAEKRFKMTPRKDGQGYFIGVHIEPRDAVWQRAPLGESIAAGLRFPIRQSAAVLDGLAQIFKGKQKAEFTGPVGIVTEMKKQLLRGPAEGLSMVAFISTLLGLFNLLPLPALDGGRLVFLAYEGTIRRRFPQRIEQSIHLVGMVTLLLFLGYVTFFKDIPRLFK